MKISRRKFKSLSEVIRLTRQAKSKGLKVVTTNGCFDLLHVGHIRYLNYAKSVGDILVVGINSDRSVRINKGPKRPIVPAGQRAEALAALEVVDYTFLFKEKSPISWLRKIKPDVHVKGAGMQNDPRFIQEKIEVEKNSGRVVLAPQIKSTSTTKLIEKIIKGFSG